MSAPWMDHPKLIVWFDDLEDAVTTAFAFTDKQRAELKALRAPRAHTWVMLAKDANTRDEFRERLREAQSHMSVPVAHDCGVLVQRDDFVIEEDSFEQQNGFDSIEVDYVEEGSVEELRRELLSDADDYAASEETGWFYSISDSDCESDVDGGLRDDGSKDSDSEGQP